LAYANDYAEILREKNTVCSLKSTAAAEQGQYTQGQYTVTVDPDAKLAYLCFLKAPG
jgi:hypothetical protein